MTTYAPTIPSVTGTPHPYKCGHMSIVPEHMGRGQARVKRIAQYFAYVCSDCAELTIQNRASRLVVLSKNEDGSWNKRPYTQEEQEAYVAKLMNRRG